MTVPIIFLTVCASQTQRLRSTAMVFPPRLCRWLCCLTGSRICHKSFTPILVIICRPTLSPWFWKTPFVFYQFGLNPNYCYLQVYEFAFRRPRPLGGIFRPRRLGSGGAKTPNSARAGRVRRGGGAWRRRGLLAVGAGAARLMPSPAAGARFPAGQPPSAEAKTPPGWPQPPAAARRPRRSAA